MSCLGRAVAEHPATKAWRCLSGRSPVFPAQAYRSSHPKSHERELERKPFGPGRGYHP